MLVQMLLDDPVAKLHSCYGALHRECNVKLASALCKGGISRKYLLNATLINPLLPYELDLERPLQGVVG